MKKNIWLLVVFISVIFVSGAATGFLTGLLVADKNHPKRRRFRRSSKEMKAMFQRHICKKLKLTDEQQKSALPIIEQWLNEMEKLRQRHAPQYTAAFNNFYSKISPILSENQKNVLVKMHKKFTKHSSPPPPPPPSFDNIEKSKKGTENETQKS